MISKKPKPKPFLEPIDKKVFATIFALGLLMGLCYAYVFSQFYAFTETIDEQTVQITEFYKENTR